MFLLGVRLKVKGLKMSYNYNNYHRCNESFVDADQ